MKCQGGNENIIDEGPSNNYVCMHLRGRGVKPAIHFFWVLHAKKKGGGGRGSR